MNLSLQSIILEFDAELERRGALILFMPVTAVLRLLPGAEGWLSDKEGRRFARLHRVEDRDRFLAAHGLQRQVLSGLLHQPPAAVQVDRDARGRPFLPQDGTVAISVTHAAQWVGLAFGRNCSVGLDVEADDAAVDWDELASSFLAAAERAEIQRLSHAARRQYSLEHWCMKEAVLKADGRGFGMDPRRVLCVPAAESGRRGRFALKVAMLDPTHCSAWCTEPECGVRALLFRGDAGGWSEIEGRDYLMWPAAGVPCS